MEPEGDTTAKVEATTRQPSIGEGKAFADTSHRPDVAPEGTKFDEAEADECGRGAFEDILVGAAKRQPLNNSCTFDKFQRNPTAEAACFA